MNDNRIRPTVSFWEQDYLEDPRLSVDAKGLLTYALLSGEDWPFSIFEVSFVTRTAPHQIKAALEELERYGYMRRD